MTRETLADDADARSAVRTLGGVRSVVDVNVFVWQPKSERWRLLALEEKRRLWERRNL
jgi:hypothetical protein